VFAVRTKPVFLICISEVFSNVWKFRSAKVIASIAAPLDDAANEVYVYVRVQTIENGSEGGH
jgi:hypothetical protein